MCKPKPRHEESRHYFVQMQAFQTMSDEEMMTVQDVRLNTPIDCIVSRPGLRVTCDICGEEIMNEREIKRDGLTLCRSCAGHDYYQSDIKPSFKFGLLNLVEHQE